jgi:EmrB/QacA subfamily drug resistance transporter
MTLVSTWLNGSAERARPGLVLIATSLGVLFAQIDTSVVNLAVKSIGADLHAGVSEMQWVIDAYNLTYASLLLSAGTLGDLHGRRHIFILGIGLFVVGTLICALAPNAVILIGGRIVSGIGAAFEVPMSLVLLTLAYPDRKQRAHALGVWASCNALAFIIGPMAGGWLVATIGWRSIFYMILPVCGAAVALTYFAIGESSEPQGRALDLPGQALAIVGLGTSAFAAIEGSHWGWSSPLILLVVGTAVTAFALFVWVEERTPGPMLPLEFLRRPVFSAALAAAGLMTFGIYAAVFIMPLYFQIIRGATPFVAGLELLPMPASFFVVSQFVGYLNNRLGPRVVMTVGMVCMGAGALSLALIDERTAFILIETALFVIGIGLGLNTAPVNGVAVAALPPERSGTASGVLNTSRMVGATLGVAILGAVFAAHAGQDAAVGPGFLSGLRAALIGSGVAELIGAAIAFAFIRHDSLHTKTSSPSAAVAERLRRHPGLLAEKPREV